MGRPGAYLDVMRHDHGMRDANVATADFGELALPLTRDEQRAQASRCMYCGVAFCQVGASFGKARPSGCPLHNLIPEWNDLVYRGLWDEAVERLSLTNPFPEFTGRVCPALCEAACNLGLHDGPTTIRDNERAISDYAWAREAGPVRFAGTTDDEGNGVDDGGIGAAKDSGTSASETRSTIGAPRVAVVGTGPSGLACAWELGRRGARVTLVERDDRAGGLLMYGIPNMKLPKVVVQRRIDLMRTLGINVCCGVDVTECADELVAMHDAVVLATGAREARRLSVKGADLPGVVLAVDYLRGATKALLDDTDPSVSAQGLDVVVIGGGDTGTDCVATALRQGCASVTQLEFLPEPPATRREGNSWPEWPNVRKDDYGQLEAAAAFGHDPRVWSTETLEVVGSTDGVSGLRVISLDWSEGQPKRIAGTERTIDAQLVLLAMGFVGHEAGAFEAFDATCVDGAHRCNSSLSVPVFAAGDCRTGSSLVVNALADGIACAAEVAQELGL